MKQKYYCPLYDSSCPYFDHTTSYCELDHPMYECDDYYATVGDDEEDEEVD